MQRTKRPIELKIVFEKKELTDTNFRNACKYVTVTDLGERQCPLSIDIAIPRKNDQVTSR